MTPRELGFAYGIGIEYSVVWIGEYRVGVIYETESLGIDFNIHSCHLCEMMNVEQFLHLDPENIWHIWTKYDDKYIPIYDKHIKDRDPVVLQKFIFEEAKEIFDEVKYLHDRDRLPQEAKETVQMMENLIENLIARNPVTIESGEIEIIENKIKDYMRGYLDE